MLVVDLISTILATLSSALYASAQSVYSLPQPPLGQPQSWNKNETHEQENEVIRGIKEGKLLEFVDRPTPKGINIIYVRFS
jgi:hypothetical protein